MNEDADSSATFRMLKYNNNGGQNDVVVGSSSSNGGVVGIPPGIILLPGTGGGCKCVIRLLDDAEVIECEIQVHF